MQISYGSNFYFGQFYFLLFLVGVWAILSFLNLSILRFVPLIVRAFLCSPSFTSFPVFTLNCHSFLISILFLTAVFLEVCLYIIFFSFHFSLCILVHALFYFSLCGTLTRYTYGGARK